MYRLRSSIHLRSAILRCVCSRWQVRADLVCHSLNLRNGGVELSHVALDVGQPVLLLLGLAQRIGQGVRHGLPSLRLAKTKVFEVSSLEA